MDLIQPAVYYFTRFLRYLMPREPKIECPHPALPPLRGNGRDSESESYGTCSRNLVLYYHNASKDVKDWTITEMRWYKNRRRLEHEYVVFTVQKTNDPAQLLFLRLDRRSTSTVLARKKTEAIIEQEAFERLSEQQKATLRSAVNEEAELLNDRHYLIHSLKKSSSPDYGVEADDTVTHTRNADGLTQATPERAELMATYSNFHIPFYLRDLAIITGVLSDYSETYLLLLQQCYWMARTIVNVVVEMYQPQPPYGITTAAFARAGRLTVASFLGSINKDNPREVAHLVDTIKDSIDKDNKKIEAVHEPQRRLQNERDEAFAERDEIIAKHDRDLAKRDQELEALREENERLRNLQR
ncbi:hypothetical protein CVT26_014684 [Gymnopilus dilepis]|uniref:Uncharacterized protein n=1 Tax=Gymnopilus dilepis TaxID=231916 RepID=A0A409W3G4_9AGAR|nr:hypothetical protein CVT26_014684 [Gymnopilus dilepis]